MGRMKHAILALTLLALSSCAMHFNKPGASTQDFSRDWANCESKAGQAGYYGGIYKKNFMVTCMNGEGWERTD